MYLLKHARGGLIDDFALGEQVEQVKLQAGIDCQTVNLQYFIHYQT